MKISSLFLAAATLIAAPYVMATDDAAAELAHFKKCAQITDDAQRLVCFDKAASVFDFAKAEKELSTARKLRAEAQRLREEKQALQKAEERRVAELETKRYEQFGQDDAEVETVKTVESEILKIRKTRLHTYLMLTNQQVWKITEKKSLGPLKEGRKVIIKKGFLGNYRLTIAKSGKTVRVERIM